jgi:CelD/BcsL family acetyltransferase involved in cellulose biosynthesis
MAEAICLASTVNSSIPTSSEIMTTSTAQGATGPLDVRECSSWNDLETLRTQWNDLLNTDTTFSIFATPEWLASWWRAYGGGKELCSLAFFSADGELVGLAPLYFDNRKRLGRKSRMLRLVGDGSGDSDNLDCIIRPGYEDACVEAFVPWLQQHEWDLCALTTLPENSAFGRKLLRYLHSAGWPVLEQYSPHVVVSLPDSWETCLARMNRESRYVLTRYPKRLRTRYNVRVYRSTHVDLEKNLSSLFALHEMRWRRRGQPGVFINAMRRYFYRELSGALLARGWLEFWLMDLDGVTAAAQFSLRFGQTVYHLQEAFDPQYSKEKLGHALRGEVLQDLIRRGIKGYDFLGGWMSHKAQFGGVESSYLTVEFARPKTLGSAGLAWKRFERRARRWAHDFLPQPLNSLLRVALHRANRLNDSST